jgi:hypothetical protein
MMSRRPLTVGSYQAAGNLPKLELSKEGPLVESVSMLNNPMDSPKIYGCTNFSA